jgi:beta-glucosidase
MHYGTPLWLENAFINASYPDRVAEYAYAFAERYKELTHLYTPLNEPMVNALYCGRRGEWPPYLEGDDGYVKVLLAVCRGVALTAQALRAADRAAILVQVEALEYHWTADERLCDYARAQQAQIYLPFDLFTGRVDQDHALVPFLRQHGVGDAELQWFHDHMAKVDVLGMNFYPISGGEWTMSEEAWPRLVRGVSFEHMAALLRDVWKRYHLPILLTETGLLGSVAERKRWMDGSIEVVRQAGVEGIPVLGYTWWPLFDMIDWAYRIERKSLRRYLIPGGLWASKFSTLAMLRRSPTALVRHYTNYIQGKR